jgi:death-on-curing protein
MSDETARFLTIGEVVAIHDEIIELCGDAHSPLIHHDTLDSAIARPANAAYYEGGDLIRQAVLLAVGISQSQAFLDGNKRAAFGAAVVFLRLNGATFCGDPMVMAGWLKQTAEAPAGLAREAVVELFEDWLRISVG